MVKGSYLADLVTIIGTQDLVFVKLIGSLYLCIFCISNFKCMFFNVNFCSFFNDSDMISQFIKLFA